MDIVQKNSLKTQKTKFNARNKTTENYQSLGKIETGPWLIERHPTDWKSLKSNLHIKKTCPCNVYPLKPHFYIEKLGYAGVYQFFFIFAPKHRLWVLVRTASARRF